MKRAMGRSAGGLVAVCGMCVALPGALAAPPVLDRVPDDAAVTIVIPSPQNMQKNLTALATAVELPFQVPALEDLMAMVGIMGGVDLAKPIAMVSLGPVEQPKGDAKPEPKPADKKEADLGEQAEARRKGIAFDPDDIDLPLDPERTVVLIPVTTYAQFLENFAVKPAGEGKIDDFVTNDGTDMHARDIGGGYAAISENKEVLATYAPKAGARPIKSRLGAAGDALTDSADIAIITNMDPLRSSAQEGLKEAEKRARERVEEMGGEDQDRNLALMKWIGETVVRDTDMSVSGLKVGAMGISLDMVGAFKPDSYLAKVFSAKSNASPLLSKLPGGSFLLAGVVDLSSPGAKTLLKDILQRAQLPGGQETGKILSTLVESSEGQGAAVGIPVGGAFAGLLTSAISFNAAKDPDALLKASRQGLEMLNGQEVEGVTVETKFTENAAKANGTPLHFWQIKLDGEGVPDGAQQAMPLVFGPEGMPSGYMAKGDGVLYRTYAKNSELMGKALAASKGDNLSEDSTIRQTQELFPKNRMAEGFLGTRAVLDMAAPLAVLGGIQVQMDKIPEKLPPIGVCASNDAGSVRMSLVIPAPVLKAGWIIYQDISMAAEQMDDGGQAPPQKGAGQPKF